jgi:hypothetical protein
VFLIVSIALLISVNSLVSNCHIATKRMSDGGGDKTYASDAQKFSLYIIATYFFRSSFYNGIKISSIIYNNLLDIRLPSR